MSMSSDTDLDLVFRNAAGKKVTLNIEEPKSGVTKAEIRAVDEELWPYARNEIYARHGYKFTKAKFKNYFEAKSWYKAGGFSTKDLSDIEWYNMELIAWMEKNEG